jgi:hypothetical protein
MSKGGGEKNGSYFFTMKDRFAVRPLCQEAAVLVRFLAPARHPCRLQRMDRAAHSWLCIVKYLQIDQLFIFSRKEHEGRKEILVM